MNRDDIALAYELVMQVQRRRVWLERLAVQPNGTVIFGSAYMEWLRVRGIDFPVPPLLHLR